MSILGWMVYLARRVGPETLETVKRYGAELAGNPEVAAAVRRLTEQAREAHGRRSPAQRLGRTLGVVRSTARRVGEQAGEAGQREQAAGWVARADRLQHAVDMLEAGAGGGRKATKAVRAEVDALTAEVLAALVGTGSDVSEGPAPPRVER